MFTERALAGVTPAQKSGAALPPVRIILVDPATRTVADRWLPAEPDVAAGEIVKLMGLRWKSPLLVYTMSSLLSRTDRLTLPFGDECNGSWGWELWDDAGPRWFGSPGIVMSRGTARAERAADSRSCATPAARLRGSIRFLSDGEGE